MLIFLFREFFFGFENANNYLKRVSQASVIPILRMKYAEIGERCNIQSGFTVHNCKNYRNLKIGENCHIGKCFFLDLRGKVTIGNNVVIAMNNTFITHLDMNNSELRKIYPASQNNIVIEDDSYLGTNCTVLMGVTIGAKAIIGAQSLVTKDVNKKTINAGIPAVKIKDIDGI
jgi:maltose O-acetyltransferase